MKKFFLLASAVIAFSFHTMAQKVVGYMPYWAGDANSIQYSKLTHINYAFAIPDTDGHLKTLQNPSKLQTIVSNAHAQGVQVLIAVGGWSENGVILDSRFETIGANATYRTNLVNDIVALVTQYNLDGADIDWEFPDAGSSANNFEALMTELYNALHVQRGKLVTAAVTAGSWNASGINNSVKNVVDWLNIMAYDENTYQHSTFSYATSALTMYENKGFAKSQLMLGVPFYGRDSWESYASLVSRGADPYQDTYAGVGYNGINTIKQKSQYVKDNGYAGIMIWELSQDLSNQYSLLTAIDQVIDQTISSNPSPSVSITSPANNAEFLYGNTLSIAANATDNGSVTKVEFFVDNVKIGEDATSPYAYTTSVLAIGSHTIMVKATDDEGATSSTSITVNIIDGCAAGDWNNKSWFNVGAKVKINNNIYQAIARNRNQYPLNYLGTSWSDLGPCTVTQNQAPTVSITAPTNNATFNAGQNITISANATDADGSISKVVFYKNGTLLGEDLTSPYSFTITSATAGTYSLTAVAIDNQSAQTTSSAINVTVNSVANQAPTVSITAPTNNATFNAGQNITISVNAADADGSISKVVFYKNGTLLGEDLTSPYSFTITSATTGTYSLTAVAIDNNNAQTTSSAINVTVNSVANQAPTVSITAPTNNATFDAGQNITISANAADADGSISKVVFYKNGTLLGEDLTSPYSFTITSATAGTYSLTAVAIDNNNAQTTSSAINVTVNSVVVGDCQYPTWNATTAYVGGDKVSYNGNEYEANWWTQGNNPETNSGPVGSGLPWTLLGACQSAGGAAPAMQEAISTTEYPNPAIDYVTVDVTLTENGQTTIDVFDAMNVVVKNVFDGELTAGTHTFEINISELPSGNYFIRVIQNGNVSFTKIVKE